MLFRSENTKRGASRSNPTASLVILAALAQLLILTFGLLALGALVWLVVWGLG